MGEKKGFPKWIIVVGVIVVLLIGVGSCTVGKYNGLVTMDEGVSSAWAQVENQYQRRMDLIPNLVSTVKGYAAHESDVLTAVSEARASAGGQVNISDEVLQDPEAFKRYQQVQDNLGASLQRLLMVTENYPELKADENFLALQDQLEGTENRIATERKRYNDAAQSFNSAIRRFPTNIIANMSGLEKHPYFEAAAGAEAAPKVEF